MYINSHYPLLRFELFMSYYKIDNLIICYRHIFFCVAIGLWAGLAIGYTTEYYTSNAYRFVAPFIYQAINLLSRASADLYFSTYAHSLVS